MLEARLSMHQVKTEKNGLVQIATIVIVISTILWTLYFLFTASDQVYIRLRLDGDATLGSKWRILFMPIVMTFTYLILRHAEKMGMINTAHKEPVSPEEASRIAANLNLLIMIIFGAVIIGMVSGRSWSVEEIATSMLLATLTVITGFVMIRLLTVK